MNEMTTEMESLKIRLKATWMAGQRFPMLMMLPVLLLETKDRHHKSGNSKSNPSQAHSTWGSHIQLIEKAQKLKKGDKIGLAIFQQKTSFTES